MKECDILTFQGIKTYFDPSYIFSGKSGPPNPHNLSRRLTERLCQCRVD